MDYEALGLRVGLEIHQQLASGHKLFCRCPIDVRHGATIDDFPFSVTRTLRPVAGELGAIDTAALYEYYRSRTFAYRFNHETACLVETDEEPPHPMNFAALVTALQACKLFQCTILDEIHTMRKTVVDGSVVSGFQRTALVGMNGSVETRGGNVAIMTVCLEEDSAPVVEQNGATVTYRLDRLGVPLVEIATDATLTSPEEAQEVAERIGTLLRSLSVVRGIGSIRQDVNVSIRGGARVEIKGFQELAKMADLIRNEVERQQALLEIKSELEKRGFQGVKQEPRDVTDVFLRTRNRFIHKAVSEGSHVYGLLLPRFAGLLKKQCGDRAFGKELNTYAKAYGYGIIHSDEDLATYELVSEFEKLATLFEACEEDALLISVGADPAQALRAITERANQCVRGVPEETRVADGTGSRYTRPLPGGERMYPESDIPAEVLDAMFINELEVPQTIEQKQEKLEKLLPKEMANQLVHSRLLPLFDALLAAHPGDPTTIATTLLSTLKDMKRNGLAIDTITETDLHAVFAAVDEGTLAASSIRKVLEQACAGTVVADALRAFRKLEENELRGLLVRVKHDHPYVDGKALISLVMIETKGRADGDVVARLIKDEEKQKK